MNSSLKRSGIVRQQQQYIQFDRNGQTQLINQSQIRPGYSYRKVHYNDRIYSQQRQKILFQDDEFKICEDQLEKLSENNRPIILKRLYELYCLYPQSKRPKFFPQYFKEFKQNSPIQQLPPFVTELPTFPYNHYKSLFLTQTFQQNGKYSIVINQNGRFSVNVVDDIVPVYKDTLQPIWGLSLQEAWKIILLKIWAKFNGSYLSIKHANAFDFIQFFTNSNWKYFNLGIDGQKFLQKYNNRQQIGKFIVKTKRSQIVKECGLIPNCAGYQIMGIKKKQEDKHSLKNWIILIHSTMKNKWAGNLSVLDKQINQLYNPNIYSMTLEKDFMINGEDFLNYFSSTYVCSRRQNTQCFSEYHLIQIQSNAHNAIYLEFQFEQAGFFDYCIKQFSGNKVQAKSMKSRFRANSDNQLRKSQLKNFNRYLKCKNALIKINDNLSKSRLQSSNLYQPLKYQAYNLDYSHGYNRGDAHFVNVIPGKYLLRIKLEKTSKIANLVINYASKQKIKMQQIQFEKDQKSLIMRQIFASKIPESPKYILKSSLKDEKQEQITFAQTFDEYGYGFVGVSLNKKCKFAVLIQVDPNELKKQGLSLKSPFKRLEGYFSVKINPGQSTSIILKKCMQQYKWPPKSIKIYQQKY